MQDDGFKVCSLCKDSKNLINFNKKSSSKDGRQNVCKKCSALASKKHYKNNVEKRKEVIYTDKVKRRDEARLFILEKLKSGCIDCDEKDPIVLDFDHVSGEKKYNLSNMVRDGLQISRIKSELEKCEIRCANCHRRKTAKQFNWYKLYSHVD